MQHATCQAACNTEHFSPPTLPFFSTCVTLAAATAHRRCARARDADLDRAKAADRRSGATGGRTPAVAVRLRAATVTRPRAGALSLRSSCSRRRCRAPSAQSRSQPGSPRRPLSVLRTTGVLRGTITRTTLRALSTPRLASRCPFGRWPRADLRTLPCGRSHVRFASATFGSRSLRFRQ